MLSERDRYAMKLLLQLGMEDNSKYRSVDSLAETIETPPDYTSKVVRFLAQQGYLDTKKGRNGGVRLQNDPEQIRVNELLSDIGAFEHNTTSEACCVPEHFTRCVLNDWIDDFKTNVVGEATLRDLIQERIEDANGAQV